MGNEGTKIRSVNPKVIDDLNNNYDAWSGKDKCPLCNKKHAKYLISDSGHWYPASDSEFPLAIIITPDAINGKTKYIVKKWHSKEI